MKLSTKIILPIILISALFLLLNGCIPTVPSPGYAPKDIFGKIETPEECCDTSKAHMPGWVPMVGATVILTDDSGKVTHTTTTEAGGKYQFTNVNPGLYVITAICLLNEEYVIKDVADKVAGDPFDAGIADCQSTALALVVEYLWGIYDEDNECFGVSTEAYLRVKKVADIYQDLNLTGISLTGIQGIDPELSELVNEFSELVVWVCYILESCCAPPEPGATGVGGGGGNGVIVNGDEVTFTLTVTIVGGGSVNLNPTGGTYSPDTIVTLDPAAATGWYFTGWSGLDAGDLVGLDPATITMNSDKAVTATFFPTFVPDQYTLTVTIVGDGSVKVGGITYTVPVTVNEGTLLALEAFAAEGWQFDGWSGDASGTSPTTSVTMNSDKTVTANFVEDVCPPLEDLSIAINPEGGTVCDDECATLGPVTVSFSDGTSDLVIALPNASLTWDTTPAGISFDTSTGEVCLNGGDLKTYTLGVTYEDECEQTVYGTVNVTFELCCPYISHIDLLPDGPIVLCPDTCFTFTEVKLYDSDGTTVIETIALPNSRVVLTSNGGTNVDITDITGGVEVCLANGGIPDAYTITATYTDICDTYTDEECVDFKVCNLPDQLTINSYTNPGPDTHYFEVNVTVSGADYDVSSGNYLGWCADLVHSGFPLGTVDLYCSYSDDPCSQGMWNKINYIINTYHTGDPIDSSTITMMDIQSAIWKFTNPIIWESRGDLHTVAAGLIYADADANGADFCPAIGQVYAAMFPRVRCPQNLFIEVPRQCHCPPIE